MTAPRQRSFSFGPESPVKFGSYIVPSVPELPSIRHIYVDTGRCGGQLTIWSDAEPYQVFRMCERAVSTTYLHSVGSRVPESETKLAASKCFPLWRWGHDR